MGITCNWLPRCQYRCQFKDRVSWKRLFGLLWFEGHFEISLSIFVENTNKYKIFRNFMIFFGKSTLIPFWNFEIFQSEIAIMTINIHLYYLFFILFFIFIYLHLKQKKSLNILFSYTYKKFENRWSHVIEPFVDIKPYIDIYKQFQLNVSSTK